MIRFLFVSRDNAYGLTRDAELLLGAIRRERAASAAAGDRTWLDVLFGRKRAEIVVHLERVHPRWLSAAKTHWLIPNQERFPRRTMRRLRRMDRVLAKTRHAEAIFRGLGVETHYLGFTSEDRRDETVAKDWTRFFHLAGGSTLKGTEDILDLWRAHPEWPELVLVQKAANAPSSVPANVRLISGYLEDAELRRLQNGCGIHLCASRSEGWGHHIVEGLSVGAVVLTTDAPPMNEHVDRSCGVPVAAARSEPRHLGTNYFVGRVALEEAVGTCIALPEATKIALGAAARGRYEAIDRGFRERVEALFA